MTKEQKAAYMREYYNSNPERREKKRARDREYAIVMRLSIALEMKFLRINGKETTTTGKRVINQRRKSYRYERTTLPSM